MMPQRIAAVASLLILPGAVFALQPGDTRDAVIAELGAPNGSAAAGDRVMMYYDRGTVQLRDGRVAEVNLVSATELAAREAKEAAAIQRMDEATQARRARLETEGTAILAAKKADASFASLPADTQLGYWRQFAIRFPMISVENEITPLAAKVDAEQRLREVEAANAARLAALEERLAEAEERAADAENMTRYGSYRRYRRTPGYFPSPFFRFPGEVWAFNTPGSRGARGHDQRFGREDHMSGRSPNGCAPTIHPPRRTAPASAGINWAPDES